MYVSERTVRELCGRGGDELLACILIILFSWPSDPCQIRLDKNWTIGKQVVLPASSPRHFIDSYTNDRECARREKNHHHIIFLSSDNPQNHRHHHDIRELDFNSRNDDGKAKDKVDYSASAQPLYCSILFGAVFAIILFIHGTGFLLVDLLV